MKGLEQVKAGDTVILRNSGSWHPTAKIVKVDRVTATQIIVGNTRFNRTRGREVGASAWGEPWIEAATEQALTEAKQIMREQQLRARINRAKEALREVKISEQNIGTVESFLKGMEQP